MSSTITEREKHAVQPARHAAAAAPAGTPAPSQAPGHYRLTRPAKIRFHPPSPLVTFTTLCAAAAFVLLLERAGVRTGLSIHFGGDAARESRWVGQYGQLTCVLASAALVGLLDTGRRRHVVPAILIATLLSAGAIASLKRLTGRVRPGFDHAGQFLGPYAAGGGGSLHHASLESFPSGHTGAAVALSVVLSALYPRGRAAFWVLAAGCGALRWVRDAHWLSDVLAGAAIGYAVAHGVLAFLRYLESRRSVRPLKASAAWQGNGGAL